MNVCVFASGNGSNFENICKQNYDYIKVKLLIVNKKDAYAITRAQNLNIDYKVITYDNRSIEEVEKEMIEVLKEYQIDFIVLAGFMRILSPMILNTYPNRIINIHPSLLPNYKGGKSIIRQFEDQVLVSGVSVHYVNNELDGGEIIDAVSFENTATSLDEFENKIHEIEYQLYPKVIKQLIDKPTKKVLVVGNGGREHALALALYKSKLLPKIYVSNGNCGVVFANRVKLNSKEEILEFCLTNQIDLTVVGPEKYLNEGIADLFLENNLKIFAPTKKASQIEASKEFAKEIMNKYGIKTAKYRSFDNYLEALDYLNQVDIPVVIKYDGLASGKGVVVCQTYEEAKNALQMMLVEKVFGSSKVIVEEFLDGVEFSYLSLVHNDLFIPLELSMDHKRAYDFDLGPNTGGMGAFSPAVIPQEVYKQATEEVMEKMVQALARENISYTGCLYGGLISTKKGVYVIEFNARFGDPETEVVLPRLKSDFLEVILNLLDNKKTNLEWMRDYYLGVVMASVGYPSNFALNKPLSNFFDEFIIHMGTELVKNTVVNTGGRVLMVCGSGKTLTEAKHNAYKKVSEVKCESLFYRKDIGSKYESID